MKITLSVTTPNIGTLWAARDWNESARTNAEPATEQDVRSGNCRGLLAGKIPHCGGNTTPIEGSAMMMAALATPAWTSGLIAPTRAGHAGQITTVVIVCAGIALGFVYLGLLAVADCEERENRERASEGRDYARYVERSSARDRDRGVIAVLARTPEDDPDERFIG